MTMASEDIYDFLRNSSVVGEDAYQAFCAELKYRLSQLSYSVSDYYKDAAVVLYSGAKGVGVIYS